MNENPAIISHSLPQKGEDVATKGGGGSRKPRDMAPSGRYLCIRWGSVMLFVRNFSSREQFVDRISYDLERSSSVASEISDQECIL